MFGQKRPLFNIVLSLAAIKTWLQDQALTLTSTLTINKTAQASTAETILSTTVTDDATAKLDIINTDASTGYYLPGILSVSKDTQRALTVIGQGTTDTGQNPLIALRGRIGASTAATVRPIVGIQKADGTSLLDFLPLNSGANLALSWGTQAVSAPAFTTRQNGTRIVLRSAIDGTHLDDAIGVQTAGPWISLQQANSTYSLGIVAGASQRFTFRGDGVFFLDNAAAAYTNSTVPNIYGTGTTGGAYPFTEAGHLVLEPRNSGAARDVVVIGSGGAVSHKFRNGGNYELAGGVLPGGTTASWSSGTGSPEGVRTAPVGSMWTRTDGGAGTTLYVKESGAGNTGWVAK